MNKRWISLALAMVLSLSLLLTACNSASSQAPSQGASQTPSSAAPSTPSDAESVKAFFIGPMSGGAAWGQAEKGFMDACAEFGWEGQYLGPTSANANNEMINLIETAITNGANVLITPVMELDMWADPLDRAREAGVTIIAINADDPDRCDAVIGTNPASIGIAAAETLVAAMKDQDIYCAPMQTNMSNTVANTAREAFEKKLVELAPNAKIVGRLECDSNAAKAQDNLSALMLSEPHLNSMMSIDSYAGLGAAALVEDRGLKGKFFAIGMDDAPEILRAVQDGYLLGTIALNWYGTGYGACELAKTIRECGTVEFNNDAGANAITAENVDQWIADHDIDMNA